MKPDLIEFYDTEADRTISTIESSFRLQPGDGISIRGEEWRVRSTSFALDHADQYEIRQLRQCVECVRPFKRGKEE